jgi:hypothetical protein
VSPPSFAFARNHPLRFSWAIEVGDAETTYKMSATDNPVSVHDKGMLLPKRPSDGSCKFALVGLK